MLSRVFGVVSAPSLQKTSHAEPTKSHAELVSASHDNNAKARQSEDVQKVNITITFLCETLLETLGTSPDPASPSFERSGNEGG